MAENRRELMSSIQPRLALFQAQHLDVVLLGDFRCLVFQAQAGCDEADQAHPKSTVR